MSILLAHELVSEKGHVVQRGMTKKRSLFGFMFHMASLWQVNGNGNLARSYVTAMVKSTSPHHSYIHHGQNEFAQS